MREKGLKRAYYYFLFLLLKIINKVKNTKVLEHLDYLKNNSKIDEYINKKTGVNISIIKMNNINEIIICFNVFDETIIESYLRNYINFFEINIDNDKSEKEIFDIFIKNNKSKLIDFIINSKMVPAFSNLPIDNADKINVNSNFIILYNSIKHFINTKIEKYINDENIKRIIFVGYSFGSILAQLAFIHNVFKYKNKRYKFITIGYSIPSFGNIKYPLLFSFLNKYTNNKSLLINLKDDNIDYIFPHYLGYKKQTPDLILNKHVNFGDDITNNHSLLEYLNSFIKLNKL